MNFFTKVEYEQAPLRLTVKSVELPESIIRLEFGSAVASIDMTVEEAIVFATMILKHTGAKSVELSH